MSVSDPLLKELKAHIFDLRRHSLALPVDDANGLLEPFCVTLEKIFRKGLIAQTPTALGCIRRDYWDCFFSLFHIKDKAGLPFKLSMAIETVSEFKKVRTSQGKGRLLLRLLLRKKLTRTAVEQLLKCRCLLQGVYDPANSILGNEILAEILLSLLYEVDKVSFSFRLRNASFLDTTWQLGVYKAFEFVPCSDMGLSVRFASGHAVVTHVQEGSIAAEDDQVQVGDVLDELYGEAINGRKRGAISALLSHFEGLPVYASFVKSSLPDRSPYPPVEDLLRSLGMANVYKTAGNDSSEEPTSDVPLSSPSLILGDFDRLPVNTPQESSGYPAIYLGKWYVGNSLMLRRLVACSPTKAGPSWTGIGYVHKEISSRWEGHVLQIERSIGEVTKRIEEQHPFTTRKVIIDIDDCYIKVLSRFTKEVLLTKHYTEIASCGRRNDMPCLFAIVAGETTCTVARHFNSYVFRVQDAQICQGILSSIAQGFSRTSWSV
ncbi:uncharacterized protein LOC8030090 isoform X2 [Ixodes scapularis]|uniref:uncharacterized protein LOC8030090 isoform X2 n=1 Tax=Ixodes scapularis TaxID=6945 RepID=UPI001A9DFE7C|nr:uncharacterized protein LOC8030090 isoform X2 [Ixodes scapularis]